MDDIEAEGQKLITKEEEQNDTGSFVDVDTDPQDKNNNECDGNGEI